MSKQIKKKVIGLVAGLSIIGGGVATAVVLVNLANANIKSFITTYDNLLEIRNRILSDYSKNASVDNQCTVKEFVNKVNDGTLKTWINDNFKDYFKSINSNDTFDFDLKLEENDNEILLTLIPTENKTLRLEQFSDKYDTSIVEFNKNNILFKFPKSEFLKEQLFSHEQLSLLQSKLIADMQKNKLTFESLKLISDAQQKTEIINWISNSLGINNVFETIDFQKLTENNAYSITLTPNKDFIFDWVNNQNNTTDFIIQRKSLTINFNKVIKIENNDLIQLREDVNIYLQQRNINYLTWLEHFDAKNQEYQELMNFIYQKLDTSLNGSFPNDCIDSLELLDNGNDVYSLKIIPSSGYSFLSNSDYYDNGNIILIDVDIYSYIEFNGLDLDSFFSKLQLSIDTERYSKEQFNQWINTPEFKDYISANLKIANGNKIEITKIKSISYDIDSNELKITPTNAYRFKLLDTSTNVIVNSDGELIISSLQLFEYIHFEQLSKLFDGFQVFIDDAKFSNDEFKEYVKDLRNLDTLKSMISNYLYTSSNHKIDSNKITNIDFVNGNLLIYFDDSYSIYSSESYENANLSTNILTIKNLRFFKVVELVKLDNLLSAIQNLIFDHKQMPNELNEYIDANLESMKNLIANNLYINDQDKLLIIEIKNVSLEPDNNIKISLNDIYTKYNIKQDLNFELIGTDLIVKNLTYFNKIEFNNLNNLFNEIQTTIKDNKFTSEEFNQFVTNDNEEFKTLIANNLYFSPTEQFSVDNIENINFDVNSNQLEITLSGNYLKYEIAQTNPDISLNDRTLIINNLRFYELIDFGYVKQLVKGIQDDITARKYTQEEFQWYVNNIGNQEYKEYISDQLHISPNVKLPIEYIIDLKVNDNYQLEVTLDDDFKKYTVSPDNNISVENDNLLLIQDLVYYSSINISNLSEAYTYIQNLILDNSLSWDDFNSYIKNNLSTITQELGSRIKISNTETIGANEIKGISINSSHNFEITLNSVNKKYTIEEFENASLSDTTITFKNLEFYTNIKLSNLNNLRNQINDLIFYKNSFTQGDFINYIKNNQTSLKNLISSSTNKLITGTGSWNVNQITNIECINGSLKITLTPPQHYKYSIESYSYASLSNNVLTITNLNFYNPTPREYFTWNGTIITGLYGPGFNQSNIVIPNTCTEIALNAFKDNRTITSITIPSSVWRIQRCAFEGCVYLANVTINEGLQVIEGWTFKWCALTSLTLPKTFFDMHNGVLDYNRYLPRIDFYSTRLNLWDRACSCLNGILSSVYFHNITNPNDLTIHEWCFADNTNNTSIWARSNVADYLASRNNLRGIYHYYRL